METVKKVIYENMKICLFAIVVLLSAAIYLPAQAIDLKAKRKLTLSIAARNRKVLIGEPLTVELNFKNESPSPVEFTYFKPHFWTPRIINPKTGEKLPFNAEIITETNIPVEKIHRLLAAGETISEQSFPLYVLGEPSRENLTYIVVNPGKYKVQMGLRLEKNEPQDWSGALESNRITVEIAAASIAVREKPKVSDARKGWEKISFAEIDKRAEFARLPDLRSLRLPKDDLEIRVWVGFGLWTTTAFIIRRSAGEWSAAYLRGYVPKPPLKNYEKLKLPKSGWQSFWKQTAREGILTLPDASELKNEKLVDDGTSFVVETNANGIYRAYHYNNPDYQELKEARQMIKISNIIAVEFDLSDFKFEQQKP